MFRSSIRALLYSLGLYRPARWLYNRLRYSRATRPAEVAGVRCIFRTPTGTIAEQIQSLTGEEALLRHFVLELKAQDVVWDIGAGFGLYTVLAALKPHAETSIIAFEPEPAVRRLLEENLALNGIQNAKLFSFALGDADAKTILYPSDTPNVGTSALLQRVDYRLKKQGIPIEMRRGDTLVTQGKVPAPTILKIDVEGAEARVLRGMQTLLIKPTLRALYCEVHPLLLANTGSSGAAVEHLITDAGFTISERYERGREYHLICLKRP
jgi:FkbM family methyltransferase